MRTIERASAFKRDYKRVKATPRHGKDVDSLVSAVVELLLVDQVLPESNRDHALGRRLGGLPRVSHQARPSADLPQTRCEHLAAGTAWLAQRAIWLR